MSFGGMTVAGQRVAAAGPRPRLVRSPRAVVAITALVLFVVVAAARLGGVAPHAAISTVARTPAAPAGLQALPLQAQGLISSTIAAAQPSFAARRTASGYALAGGGLAAGLRRGGGAVIRSGDGLLLLSPLAIGRRLVSAAGPGAVRPAAHRNRVTFAGHGWAEWFAAGPLGVEQGFTVGSRRAAGGGGELTVALRVGGSLVARRSGAGVVFSSPAGRAELRYAGLAAVDVTGRSLPAAMILGSAHTLVLRIDVRGARFPVRIDPFMEQTKLAPTGANGDSGAGSSVAVSSNGDTALVGGPDDNNQQGAAWIFVRSGTTWTQQQEIVPPDLITNYPASDTPSEFGVSVALSADGNTALIGGSGDDNLDGAAWVYVRSGSAWTEQDKIVPGDEIGNSGFGQGVALSADGDTALIGGYEDGPPNGGAAWVYGRSGGTWSEQTKIIPPDETEEPGAGVGSSDFGWSVALSAAGTTALIGGPMDGIDGMEGAAWFYKDSGGSWSETAKVVPSDQITGSGFGFGTSVALSPDGSTALIGSPADNGSNGAAWIYVPSGNSWTEQQRLVPPASEDDGSQFGSGVALSTNGDEALIGGDGDNTFAGALWVYTRSGSAWTDADKIIPTDESGGASSFGTAVALSADGTTALSGGPTDGDAGAAWVYTVPVSSVVVSAPPGAGRPSCALASHGDVIAVVKAKTTHAKSTKKTKPAKSDATGTLSLVVTCSQPVNATVTATLAETVTEHGRHHVKNVGLAPAHAVLTTAKRATTVAITIPAAVVKALKQGTRTSASFALRAVNTNGTATATAKIAKLKL